MTERYRVGEVIEASTTGFVAQCYELYQIPPLGSLVKTGDASLELYGVVCGARTASADQGRRPIARGRDEPNEEAIYRANPQLSKLLLSEFSALVVGHRRDGRLYQYLPPQPARIHGFVYLCPAEEVSEFSKSLHFLDILISARAEVSPDELISACLRQMSQVRQDGDAFLVAVGKELAIKLSGQFDRLKSILVRIKQ